MISYKHYLSELVGDAQNRQSFHDIAMKHGYEVMMKSRGQARYVKKSGQTPVGVIDIRDGVASHHHLDGDSAKQTTGIQTPEELDTHLRG